MEGGKAKSSLCLILRSATTASAARCTAGNVSSISARPLNPQQSKKVPLCPPPDCRPTEYGPDCSLPCQCAPSSSYCNAQNGQCLCLNGYTGPTCREGNV